MNANQLNENYFYPVLGVAPNELTSGQYTFWNGRIYSNDDGTIKIVNDKNFYFYRTDTKIMYQKSGKEITQPCINAVMFNIIDHEWVLITNKCCDDYCVSSVQEVVCQCYVPETNVINGTIDNEDVDIWDINNFSPGTFMINKCLFGPLGVTKCLIRNVGSNIGINTFGIQTDFPNYVKFNLTPDGESIPVLPNHTYTFQVSTSMSTYQGNGSNNYYNYIKYVFPTYESVFQIKNDGIIRTNPTKLLTNNQLVFIPSDFMIDTISNEIEIPIFPLVMMFVNQPEPYFVKLAYIAYSTLRGEPCRMQASVQVNIIKKPISFTASPQ